MSEVGVRCTELIELVTEWMDGELDEDTRARIEEHLVVCAPCTAYVTQLRQSIAAMERLDLDAPPAAVRDELLRAFRASRND